jgi:hypothetical protein
MPATIADTPAWKAANSDVAAYLATLADGRSALSQLKAVLLSDGPSGLWLLDDAATAIQAADATGAHSAAPTGGVNFAADVGPGSGRTVAHFMVDTALTAQITSGQQVTALQVSPLPFAIPSGALLRINFGGSPSQNPTSSQAVAAGATSIPVQSFTANATYAVGTVVDYAGLIDTGFVPPANANPFSVEVWYNAAFGSRYQFPRLVSTGPFQNAGGGWAIALNAASPDGGLYTSGSMNLWLGSANTKQVNFSWPGGNAAMNTGWHQLVSTWDGANLKLYTDGGNPTGAIAGPAGWTQSNLPLTIGASIINATPSFGEFWNGPLAAVGFYPSQLSAAQIANHYLAGKEALAALATIGDKAA